MCFLFAFHLIQYLIISFRYDMNSFLNISAMKYNVSLLLVQSVFSIDNIILILKIGINMQASKYISSFSYIWLGSTKEFHTNIKQVTKFSPYYLNNMSCLGLFLCQQIKAVCGNSFLI